VVCTDEVPADVRNGCHSDTQYVIIPSLYPAGTITRRAVDPTWLTASNAKVKRLHWRKLHCIYCCMIILVFGFGPTSPVFLTGKVKGFICRKAV